MAEKLLTTSIAAPGFKLMCTVCKEEKDTSAFHKAGNKKRGYQFSCKVCKINKREERKASMSHADWALINRRNWLRTEYGLSLEDYGQMLKKQDHKCAICKTDETDVFKQVLYVDHCHNTGKIRGLLCMQCNAGLGKFKDSLDMLEAAKDYLKKATNG